MNTYLVLKLIHIISASILFGTGIGTAFFMLRAYLSGNVEALTVTARIVVLADWLFTAPAVLVQLATGVWLMTILRIPFDSLWFVVVISLFVFVGLCWIPVVGMQIRMRDALAGGATMADIAPLMRLWSALGAAAFLSMIVLFMLMVSKYGIAAL